MDKNYIYGAYLAAKDLDNGLAEAIKRLSEFMEPSDPYLRMLIVYKNTSEKVILHLKKGGVAMFCEKGDQK